jgi:serpin B
MKKLLSSAVLAGICTCCPVSSGGETTEGGDKPVPTVGSEFAINLYHRWIADAPGNAFVSPFSIESVLAMTAVGAKGETRKQILETLHISDPQEYSNVLVLTLSKPDQDSPEFHLASALWAQSGFLLRNEYVQFLRERFKAQARMLDFQDPEWARSVINQWVNEQTREKISNLLPPGSLTPNTRVILTNTIYFRADWLEKFEPLQTKKAPFQVQTDRTVEVDMMHLGARLRYAETGASHVVSLPYVGATASMYLIVPKTPDGLKQTEKELTPEWMSGLDNRLRKREVRLGLPRFQITDAKPMSKILHHLGITDAFDPQQADFSGISEVKPFFIQQIYHKTYITVDEKGTPATGATGLVMAVTSLPIPEEPVEIVVDRPFVFLIRDHRTGAILFIGRLCDPSGVE